MKQQDEKLSLLLDDHSDDNVDEVLDEVIADVNLQYRVRRYRMIGEVMRHEIPAAIDTGFHQQVMAKIQQQAQPVDPARHAAASVTPGAVPSMVRAWFRPAAGLAVAASVALVTVALWQPLQQQTAVTDDGLVSADEQKIQQLAGQQIAGGAVPASTRVQSEGMRWKLENESPMVQQKLNAYLVNHTEYSNSMQGLIPQARVAGFDAQ
jgi:sigma-E factor negative regulatory protein RseA